MLRLIFIKSVVWVRLDKNLCFEVPARLILKGLGTLAYSKTWL